MYLANLSSRKMRNQLKRHFKTKVSHITILDWVRKYISTKSEDWLYEKEWRILYHEGGTQTYLTKELSGVILGARISEKNEENEELVRKWILESNCKPKLYRAEPFKNRFGLDIKPL